ncbi:unnamed protein product [Hymenolepis diminuta]|uniref:PDZ domain-containing protein n=1 Tax=Hymenolepis diminuta TaxID=6216 RepID=A0A0R3SXL6_HYMDI|nr:unnamed protein product [Hymenolepis diminuta]
MKSSGSQIVISQVRAGGAAELAGLKVGSIVKSVNQQSIKDMSFLQVSNLIRRSSSLTTELTVCIPEEMPPAMNGNVVLRHTSAAKNPAFAPDSFSDVSFIRIILMYHNTYRVLNYWSCLRNQ